MAIIDIENLTKIYHVKKKKPGFMEAVKSLFAQNETFCTAVDDISFSINEGEIVGVLGPNGAGKTTTLKMLSGLLYPSQGKIEVNGYIPWKRENGFKKQIGMVTGQKNQLMWDLSAMDSFLWLKAIYDIPNETFKKTISDLADVLDIEEKLNVQLRHLSFGQRMKLELIACLLHSPKVLFLDEPTIGLDITTQNRIHCFLKQHNREHNTTILLTSHNMMDIEEMCKRVIVINHGKVSHDGDVKNLAQEYCNYKIIDVNLNSNQIELEKFGDDVELINREEQSYLLRVHRSKYQKVASKLWAEYDVSDLNIQDPDISEIIKMLFLETEKTNSIL